MKYALALLLIAAYVASQAARRRLEDGAAAVAARPPRRIVSMAPSVTESLYALGLGERVVGVTRYCNYPPAARDKPRVGGVLDPNIEAIVALRPDLAVGVEGSEADGLLFARLGIGWLAVSHRNVDGLIDSLATLGDRCGAADEAARLVAGLKARLDRVARKTAGLPRPRVLFVVERSVGAGRIEDAYAAGADGHIDRLVELAGGANAVAGGVRFPVLSAEGILRINPEVVIDLIPQLAASGLSRQAAAAEWQSLDVAAVARGRVHVLDADYLAVPGPRLVDALETLARLIHPEAGWE